VEWFGAANGGPVLRDAISYLECTVASRMETPDHWITYAQVGFGLVTPKPIMWGRGLSDPAPRFLNCWEGIWGVQITGSRTHN
jgi:flavin reductase (DIM6/NTAB) family NADH-FMN oxidoreductase RutF